MKRILLACCLVLLGTAAGATVKPSPQPKSLLIEEAIGNPYYVTFIFDSSVPRAPAERHARRAITAAGLRAIYIDTYEEQGTFRVEVETNLGRKSGRFQWTIDATPLRHLLGSGGQRIVLELPSLAEALGGSLRPAGGDTSHRRYVVTGVAPIVYRINAPLWPLLLLAAVALLAHPLMRSYAQRVERRTLETPEKVHRLQRAGAVSWILGFGMVTFAVLVGADVLPELLMMEIAPSLAESAPLLAITSILYMVLFFVLPAVAIGLAISPSYRRLRGIRRDRRQAVRKTALGLLLFVPILLWFPFLSLVWSTEGVLPVILEWVGLVVLVIVVNPLILLKALDTYELQPQIRERLLGLCRELRLRVRDVRGMRGRWQKTANALMVGFVTPLRYIVLSDYLLDHFKDDEVDAVMAHEIAHGKQHHLLKKLGAFVIAGIAFAAVVAALEVLVEGISGAITFMLPLLFPLLIILIQGVVGIRLEKKADEFAVDVIGLDPALRAIDKLAELNQVRRRTGFLWNLLTQHPGIEQRLEHMRICTQAGSHRATGLGEVPSSAQSDV